MSASDVFRLRNRHLGDNWTTIAWLLAQSELSGRPMYLEKFGVTWDGMVWATEVFAKRIIALFDSPGRLEFTEEIGELVDEEKTKAAWRVTCPTRKRWTGGDHICIQLVGSWMSHQKNTPEREAILLLQGLTEMGFDVIPLCAPMSIEEGVDLLTTCRFFIGIDSGYMHVAHSVGCPRFLIRNQMPWIDEVHGGKKWIGCANAVECFSMIRSGRLPETGH